MAYAHQRAGALLSQGPDDVIDLLREYLSGAGEGLFVAGCWKLLGKALDRVGRYDWAFHAFQSANALTKRFVGIVLRT